MYKTIINSAFVFLLFASCASARQSWYVEDVGLEKRKWRWCHESKDGPEYHEKGICYISRRCRKRLLMKPKCERVPLFCAHGDMECLRKNKWPLVRRGGEIR